MKRKIISCASALFFLAVFNCKRDKPDPECRDASCCGPTYNRYVRYVEDEPISLTGPPYLQYYAVRFTKKLSGTSIGAERPIGQASICSKSLNKIEGFPLTHTSEAVPDSFPYRVSGKLLVYEPIQYQYMPYFKLYIDKIEKIN